MAVLVAALVSAASVAEAQATPAEGRGAVRKEMRGMKGMQGRHGRGNGGMLKGITLSEAEKAQLKAIRTKYQAEHRTLRTSLRPAMQEARAARQKGDTVALKALRARNAASRGQVKALMDRQRAEIRGALTAEHQKQFDANVTAQAARRAEWAKQGGKPGEMKGKHKGHRGMRGAGANG